MLNSLNSVAQMVMVDLKGLYTVRMPGRTYYYAWRGGPRITAPYGTPEFHAEFAEAHRPYSGYDTKKFGAWVTLYKASEEYAQLANSTKRVWNPWLDEAKSRFGKLSMRLFDQPSIRVDIKKWREKWRDRPRAADTAKQVLSRVLSFAVSEGGLGSNPCEGIPNLYEADRSDFIWLAEDLTQLSKHASKEVMWAARLAALSGLRQGDLLKLSWTQIGANAIEIKTGKSRRRKTAVVPVMAELRTLLGEITKRATTVLTNADGQPWKGFGSSWNKAMKKAWPNGRNLHFHDLRGTAATNFYRAGLTTREIAEIMAWSEDRVERLIDHYVKRDEILRDRIRRIDEAQKRLTSGG